MRDGEVAEAAEAAPTAGGCGEAEELLLPPAPTARLGWAPVPQLDVRDLDEAGPPQPEVAPSFPVVEAEVLSEAAFLAPGARA